MFSVLLGGTAPGQAEVILYRIRGGAWGGAWLRSHRGQSCGYKCTWCRLQEEVVVSGAYEAQLHDKCTRQAFCQVELAQVKFWGLGDTNGFGVGSR